MSTLKTDGISPPRSGKGRRILIVDDDQTILDFASQTLLKAGYVVQRTLDSRNVLFMEEIGSPLPELILLDVAMPNVDGLHLAFALRSNPRTFGIPIILMSGEMKAPPGYRLGELCGGKAYLDKPFTEADLLTSVALVLGLK